MLQKTIGKAVLKTLNKTAPKYAKVVAKIARKSETKITELSKFEKRIVKFFEDLAEKYSEKSTKATKLAKKMEDTTKEIEQENWDFLKEADDLVDVTGDVAEEGLEIGAKGAQKSVPKIKGYERKIGVRTSNLKKSTEFKKMLDEDKVMKELYKKTEFSPSSAVMVAEGTAGVAQAAPQIAANYVKMVVNRIKADMALLEGRLGELDEETKALINIIKKFIAQLMELILGMGDWIQDVGKQQGKLWQDRSRVLSQIVSQA